MTLCHLSKKGFSRGAWAALLAWSAVAGCGEVIPVSGRPDAAIQDPGPLIDAGPRPDSGTGMSGIDAGPSIDAGPLIDAGPSPDASLACVVQDLGSQIGNAVFSGDTTGQLDRSESCGGEPGFGDVALLWTAPTTGRYGFDTCGSTYDTILTARTPDCSGMELKCNDDSMGCGTDSLQSRFSLDLVEGERLLLVVDGFDAEGPFQLNIEAL
jgi:hypothetical protein